MWKLKTPIALMISLTLLMSFSVGCGKRIPTGSDQESPAPQASSTPFPVVTEEPTPLPTVEPTPAPQPGGQLHASLQGVKNGLLGMGSIEATVLVVNDTQNTLSGELRVQFTDGGKADPTHLQTMQVTLQGGEQKTYIFRDKSWSMDNATVEAVTAQSTNASYSGGYGASYKF